VRSQATFVSVPILTKQAFEGPVFTIELPLCCIALMNVAEAIIFSFGFGSPEVAS
jgi:hypothetical protein